MRDIESDVTKGVFGVEREVARLDGEEPSSAHDAEKAEENDVMAVARATAALQELHPSWSRQRVFQTVAAQRARARARAQAVARADVERETERDQEREREMAGRFRCPLGKYPVVRSRECAPCPAGQHGRADDGMHGRWEEQERDDEEMEREREARRRDALEHAQLRRAGRSDAGLFDSDREGLRRFEEPERERERRERSSWARHKSRRLGRAKPTLLSGGRRRFSSTGAYGLGGAFDGVANTRQPRWCQPCEPGRYQPLSGAQRCLPVTRSPSAAPTRAPTPTPHQEGATQRAQPRQISPFKKII